MRTHRHATTVALAIAALAVAACGGTNEAAQDSAAADSAGLAPPVGSFQDAADSAVSAGSATIDSLRDAGVTPMQGIDSAAARGVTSSAADTAAIPGQVQMRPRPGATTGPGARRP